MFESFKVEGFRGFDSLELGDLARVNLIVGANNTGKTALLEAIQLLCQPGRFRSYPDLEVFELLRQTDKHTKDPENTIAWLFHRADISRTIRVSATARQADGVLAAHEVVLSVLDNPPGFTSGARARRGSTTWPIIIRSRRPDQQAAIDHRIDAAQGEINNHWGPSVITLSCMTTGVLMRDLSRLARWYSQVDQEGQHEVALRAMQRVDSRLKRISVTTEGDRSILQVDLGMGRLMPVSFLGDGFVRMLALAIKLAEAKGGVLLIDEIEASFHREALDKVWEFLRDTARELDVQVFATTHNWETIEAAHAAFKAKAPYDFAIYRLARAGDAVSVSRLGEGPIDFALRTRFEIR